MSNPVYDKLVRCYESIKDQIPFTPKVALILGSGLGDYADGIETEGVIEYRQYLAIRDASFLAMLMELLLLLCRGVSTIMKGIQCQMLYFRCG